MIMKKITSILILIASATFFLYSCDGGNNKSSENKKNKEDQIPENHELIKTEAMTIVENSDSKTEFDMISRSSVNVKGYKLERSLELLAGENPGRVITEGNFPDIRMKIEYKPVDTWSTTEEENRQLVLDSLKMFYDFSVEKEKREMPVYHLISVDSSKLNVRTDEALGTSATTIGSTKDYKNHTFSKLMSELEIDVDAIFMTENDDGTKYDFKDVKINNLDKVLKSLKENYGMEFNEKTETIEAIVVKMK